MEITVDAWDPSFAENAESPSQGGAAIVDANVETDAAKWEPVRPFSDEPRRIAVVDGVRRLDARVELSDGPERWPGLCVSWGAGAVLCDLDAGRAAVVTSEVRRGLFCGAEPDRDLKPYPHFPVDSDQIADLVNASQNSMSGLEADVAAGLDGADLAVLDGPLRGRRASAGAVGYVKSHQRSYLAGELGAMVETLRPGERTPVFQLTTTWPRYSAYVRLPSSSPRGWNGIARLEAPDNGAPADAAEAVRLIDSAAAVLPRLASQSFKDPRAPQNLTPIAGLERRLKHLMGDARLLLRTVRRN
ncbi:DNA double-strand break repair nuclease NurA [Salininema proteolyticum]|uniref:DNA double-strand break repair nuclease NurA n=1 Tax=Salininema proteolyticum TaxID=1607685 RepID=A0ABV8U0P4_9ACTN